MPVAVLASVGVALLLYVLGTDWGRWVSLQMFLMMFMVVAAHLVRRAPFPAAVYGAILCVHLLLGFWHMVPVPLPGFVQTMAEGPGTC